MAIIVIASLDGEAVTTLSNELEAEGHKVRWAGDGQEACEMAVGAALVFLERELPVFSGFEVAAILRGDPDIPRDLPILLLDDDAVDPHVFDHSGFTGQFRKSHSYHEVRELVSVHLRDTVVP